MKQGEQQNDRLVDGETFWSICSIFQINHGSQLQILCCVVHPSQADTKQTSAN